MFKSSLLASVAVIGIVGAASASDVAKKAAPAKAPAQAARVGWTGFHVGIGGGADYLSSDLSSATTVTDTEGCLGPSIICFDGATSASANAGKFGFFGTAELGYDVQLNDQIVVGLVGNYDLKSRSKASAQGDGYYVISANDSEGASLGPIDYGSATTNLELNQGNSWAVLARMGFLATPSTLVYGLAGYSQSEYELSGSVTGYGGVGAPTAGETFGPFPASTGRKWLGAFVAGAGIETMLSDHVSLKMEYRYADYGKMELSGGGTYTIGLPNPYPDFDVTAVSASEAKNIVNQSVRGVLSYRF